MEGPIISLAVNKEYKKSSGCTFTESPISEDYSGPGVYGFSGDLIITAGGCGADFNVCFTGNDLFVSFNDIGKVPKYAILTQRHNQISRLF